MTINKNDNDSGPWGNNGGGNNQNPWGKRPQNNSNPPDVDEIIRKSKDQPRSALESCCTAARPSNPVFVILLHSALKKKRLTA